MKKTINKQKPIFGKYDLKKLPYSMPYGAPLFELKDIMHWDDSDFVIVDFMSDAKSVSEFLPKDVSLIPVPDAKGACIVKHIWADYRDSSVGPYKELIIAVPCMYKGKMWLFVPFIYVTTDSAISSGREIGGWPKKIANIDMIRFGDEVLLSFERNGMELGGRCKVDQKLFSTPLPPKKTIELPFPQNVTLGIPKPTGKPQPSILLPTLTFKWISGVGSKKPKPALAQMIGAPWRLSGEFSSMKDVSVNMHPTEEDPLHKLPVLKILGATYVKGYMTLKIEEIKVLKDYLKR